MTADRITPEQAAAFLSSLDETPEEDHYVVWSENGEMEWSGPYPPEDARSFSLRVQGHVFWERKVTEFVLILPEGTEP